MSDLHILLVEDNMGDVVLFKHALEAAGASCRVQVVPDGEAAIELLRACAVGQEACPGLLVLDLNLPKMGGLEVIRKMGGHPGLRAIPLVVLTSSQHEAGVLDDWDPKRSLYLVKPATFRELVDRVRHMLGFFKL